MTLLRVIRHTQQCGDADDNPRQRLTIIQRPEIRIRIRCQVEKLETGERQISIRGGDGLALSNKLVLVLSMGH